MNREFIDTLRNCFNTSFAAKPIFWALSWVLNERTLWNTRTEILPGRKQSMKSHIYELAMQASRRQVLKGVAGATALAAGAGTLGAFPKDARADFRADLLKKIG